MINYGNMSQRPVVHILNNKIAVFVPVTIVEFKCSDAFVWLSDITVNSIKNIGRCTAMLYAKFMLLATIRMTRKAT